MSGGPPVRPPTRSGGAGGGPPGGNGDRPARSNRQGRSVRRTPSPTPPPVPRLTRTSTLMDELNRIDEEERQQRRRQERRRQQQEQQEIRQRLRRRNERIFKEAVDCPPVGGESKSGESKDFDDWSFARDDSSISGVSSISSDSEEDDDSDIEKIAEELDKLPPKLRF